MKKARAICFRESMLLVLAQPAPTSTTENRMLRLPLLNNFYIPIFMGDDPKIFSNNFHTTMLLVLAERDGSCMFRRHFFPKLQELANTHTHTYTYINFSIIFVFHCIVCRVELNSEKCCPETPSKWATTKNMPLCGWRCFNFSRNNMSISAWNIVALPCPKCITISPAGS